MLGIISNLLISFVSVWLTYLLGRWQNRQLEKKRALTQKYDKFYAPFISLIYILHPWDCGFSVLPEQIRGNTLSFLFRNTHFLTQESISLLLEVSRINSDLDSEVLFSVLNKIPHDVQKQTEIKELLDERFNNLAQAVLMESQSTRKGLFRSASAEAALTMFAQSGRTHSKAASSEQTRFQEEIRR